MGGTPARSPQPRKEFQKEIAIVIQRILAHNIVWQGRTYHMHIAELDPETGKVTMRAFDHEIPSTIFISGTVLLIME